MTQKFDLDLIVIGAGSGGVRAARIAASYGAKVAIIEEQRPGGTCVLRGCIPKKLLVYASEFRNETSDMFNYGWQVKELKHDWSKLINSKNKELDRLSKIYENLLTNAGCELVIGRAGIVSKNSVKINQKILSTEKILIATGGEPYIPDIKNLKSIALTSDEALDLKSLPTKILIFGSGYIAVEFACIFNGFGSEVHLVYRADKVLRGFDKDVRDCLEKELTDKGIRIYPKTTIDKIEILDTSYNAFLSNGMNINISHVLAATGRTPNIKGLGLKKIGVKQKEDGAIIVDKYSRTNIKSIFAIGDVTNRINLTPFAIAEGHAFADREFGNKTRFIEEENVPSAVFSQPPISCVGFTEDEALKNNMKVDIYTSHFKPLKNTLSGNPEKSFMKLVIESKSDKVIGAHMIGVDSPEIIQCLSIAVKVGLQKKDLDSTLGIHPTAAEEFVTMRNVKKLV